MELFTFPQTPIQNFATNPIVKAWMKTKLFKIYVI